MSQEYGKFLTMALITKANDKGGNLRGTAKEVGISDSLASDWIRGKAIPTDEEIQKICDHLGCSVADVKKFADAQAKKQGISIDAPAEPTKTTEKAPAKVAEPKKDVSAPKEKTPEVKKDDFPMPEPVKAEEAPKAKEPVEAVKADTPAPKDVKPKKAKTTTPKASATTAKKPTAPAKGNELVLAEDMDTFVRKNAGLKKSEPVTKADLLGVFNNVSSEVKERLSELSRLEQSVADALYSSLADDKVEPKLEKLVATARNATDEGLDLAITILEKFAK